MILQPHTAQQALPRFLILRFAPGAAGNMISSLLQCSPEITHWDPDCQSKKPQVNWLEYFQRVFPDDMKKWVYHEPVSKLSWGTREIFSAKYPRGDDLGTDEFLDREAASCNKFYHENKRAGRYLPIFWHKPNMASYFVNSKCVIISLDRASLRWFDHAVYHKHHNILSHDPHQITVQLLENRPEAVLPQFRDTVDFEKCWRTFRHFVRERILENPFRQLYCNVDLIPPWSIPTVRIDLSDLLNKTRIVKCYQYLCEELEITPVLDANTICTLHCHWRNQHAI